MMKTNKSAFCQNIKSNGSRCGASPLAGSRFCFFHDPAKARERQMAQKAGGRARSRRIGAVPPGTPDRPLESARDAIALLRDVINRVLKAELDPKLGTTVGYLLTVFLKAGEQYELESRVTKLEALRREPRPSPNSPLTPYVDAEKFTFEIRNQEDGDEKSE